MADRRKEKVELALCRIVHRFFHLFPIKDRVVFSSFGGSVYNDNPRAVSQALHEMDPDVEQVWMLPADVKDGVPDYIVRTGRKSFKALYYYATVRVLVDNFSIPKWFRKRKDQFYIMTWHGDRGFKKILYDAHDSQTFSRPEREICDLMTAGSKRGEVKFRSAFRYQGEILKAGSPRNDLLLHPDPQVAEDIRERFQVPDDVRVLLYAPTFRRKDSNGFEIKGLDLKWLLDQMKLVTGEEWVCFLRAHKASKGFKDVGEDRRLIDVTEYPDMNELMLVADFLITDYSSSAGDFALTGKPIVLFRNDSEEYMNNDRTFYFDIRQTPFKVANDQNEIPEQYAALLREGAAKNCDEILEFYGCYETGHASEDCVRWIRERLE